MTSKLPERNQFYTHKNGNEYLVEFVANVDSDRPEYPTTVVYRGEDNAIWAKPLEDFLEKMTFSRNRYCCRTAAYSNGWHHDSCCPKKPTDVF